LPHGQAVLLEQPAPVRERQEMFVDVLLGRALMAHHLPADEILIRHHDAEPAARLGDALHLFEPLAHVQKMLERSEAADAVE